MTGTGQRDRGEASSGAESAVDVADSEGPERTGVSVDGEVREVSPEPEAGERRADAAGEGEADATDPAGTEGQPAAPSGDPPPDPEETEIESLLGPGVRTPVGIPKDYRPLDTSLHALFHVELEDFAGPMDLLLYLIRKHEIDVFDIPITFIADRYMEMLRTLEALEIDVAAEFLVLAADLVHIKSKMLLPAKEGEPVEDEPEPEIDPREELVRRLLEYQKYRDAADQLGDRDQLGRDVFARVPPDSEAVDDVDPGLKSVSIFKLVEVMAKMMRRTPKVSHSIELEHFSIAERIRYVMGFGEAREGRFTLVQLLEGIRTRAELVVTFIAVLEMTKLGLAKILIDEEHPAEHPMMPPHEHVDGWQDGLPDVEPPPEDEVEGALHPEQEVGPAGPGPAAAEGASPPGADAEGTIEPTPVEPSGAEVSVEGSPTEADGALEETRRLARELEALEASMEAEEAEERAREEARARAAEARAQGDRQWEEEPLPTIWVVLSGKKFEGDILDDYQ